MKVRLTLFARMLAWYFATLLVSGVVLYGLFLLQFRLPPESGLRLDTGPQLLGLGRLVAVDLDGATPSGWDAVLDRYSREYDVTFRLVANSGRLLAGPSGLLPPAVMEQVTRPEPPGPRARIRLPSVPVPPPTPQPAPHSPQTQAPRVPEALVFTVHTNAPSRYWAGVRMPVFRSMDQPPIAATLLADSDSVTGHGLFLNPLPFVVVAGVIVVLASLMWLPLARSMTRPIARITEAAERVARGQFDVRVDASRGDELGRLAGAINDMSARLGDHVRGQKRFLGDVAHELASPVARLRLGLEIMASRVQGDDAERVADVLEEVQHMSGLVDELLSFTRAEVAPRSAHIEAVDLHALAGRVVAREGHDGADLQVDVSEDFHVLADRELLARALGNLVRNALRYATEAGPIRIVATRESGQARIDVIDQGPGVPEESLPRLFEPFFRPEGARSRDTGGSGLGLAIVWACVTACNGTVQAGNLAPRGFAVTIRLEAPPSRRTSHVAEGPDRT